ncbi:MAG: carboxypeptidase-like regulatory domain-containing protein [Chitinophagaceae bacterium]
MRRRTLYFILFAIGFPLLVHGQNSTLKDSIVEFSGLTMTADSLQAIPGVSIQIKGQDRGTISNEEGAFSIVGFKGEVIVFSAIGFKNKEFRIPLTIKGSHFSKIQLLVRDTTYLPETIIRPFPTREEFARDFVNGKIPNDRSSVIRANTSLATLRAMMRYLPVDGRESSGAFLNQQAQSLYYYGQRPPENIFNPLAWAQFIEAWKRGDFKKGN